MNTAQNLHIDLDAVIHQRLPRQSRFIPRFLINGLKKFIRQDNLNQLLDETAGLRGADFCAGVLAHLGITTDVVGRHNIPGPESDTRVIFVSNHPLGGLDGLALIDTLTRLTGSPLKFIVNDLLMAVTPLSDVFIPINKLGAQGRNASMTLNNAMESNLPVVIFPAGLVSRKNSDGTISDLTWQKTFINRAIKHRRDIIPIHFSGENSSFFYNFARLRTRLGLKFNIEMLRLPAEIFRSRQSHFTITAGSRIPYQLLHGGADAVAEAEKIKQIVYNLPRK